MKLLPIMMNRPVLARARMCCVQAFCFHIVLSNGDGDSKNDTVQSTNQLFYVGVYIWCEIDGGDSGALHTGTETGLNPDHHDPDLPNTV